MEKDLLTSLFSQGAAVGVAAWFMFRLEGLLKEYTRQQQLTNRALTLIVANAPHASEGDKAAAAAIAKEVNGDARQ